MLFTLVPGFPLFDNELTIYLPAITSKLQCETATLETNKTIILAGALNKA
jgi:hypothetical protein